MDRMDYIRDGQVGGGPSTPLVVHTASSVGSYNSSATKLLPATVPARSNSPPTAATSSVTPSVAASAASSSSAVAVARQTTTLAIRNLDPQVNETLLTAVFTQIAPVRHCRMVSRDFAVVQFADHAGAMTALQQMHGRKLLSSELVVEWQTMPLPEDTAQHKQIFVGDLAPDVTDLLLRTTFSAYSSVSSARVMVDPLTRRSRSFGFVSFRDEDEAMRAITEMNGRLIAGRAIRTGQAFKASRLDRPAVAANATQTGVDASYAGIPGGASRAVLAAEMPGTLDYASTLQSSSADNTTVYIGNITHGTTDETLRQHFQAFGEIRHMRPYVAKGFCFLTYASHEQAAAAICSMNGIAVNGRNLRCSWGTKSGGHPSALARAAGGPLAGMGGRLGVYHPLVSSQALAALDPYGSVGAYGAYAAAAVAAAAAYGDYASALYAASPGDAAPYYMQQQAPFGAYASTGAMALEGPAAAARASGAGGRPGRRQQARW